MYQNCQLINSYLETTKKNVRNGNSLKSVTGGNGGSVNLSASLDYSQFRDELPDLSHTFSKSMVSGTMGPPQVCFIIFCVLNLPNFLRYITD